MQSACTHFFFPTEQVQKQVLSLKKRIKKKKDVYHYTDLKYVGVIFYAHKDLIHPTPSHTRIQHCVLAEFSTATGLQNS